VLPIAPGERADDTRSNTYGRGKGEVREKKKKDLKRGIFHQADGPLDKGCARSQLTGFITKGLLALSKKARKEGNETGLGRIWREALSSLAAKAMNEPRTPSPPGRGAG